MNREELNNINFYVDMIPKFLIHLFKNYRNIWISFLDDEAERLRVEVYSLRNKRLNEKHGDFDKHRPYGGVTKALEIGNDVRSKMAHVGKDIDFQEMVDAKTEPYTNIPKKDYVKSDEEVLQEKQEKFEGNGLGEIVGVKEEIVEEVDDGREEDRA